MLVNVTHSLEELKYVHVVVAYEEIATKYVIILLRFCNVQPIFFPFQRHLLSAVCRGTCRVFAVSCLPNAAGVSIVLCFAPFLLEAA